MSRYKKYKISTEKDWYRGVYVKIPQQLYNQAKSKAILEKKTMKQLFYELLRDYVDSDRKE